MKYDLFITCTPGLEHVLKQELETLSISCQTGNGGVFVENCTFEDVMMLNLYLRTASRVLIKLYDIHDPTKKRLYHESVEYDWKTLFAKMPTFAIQVPFMNHPEFTNSMYVGQLVKDAICDRLRKDVGSRPSVEKEAPQMLFHVVVEEDKASVYFDSSNEPLFKRGYRTEQAQAPLKETLAAAILLLASYNPSNYLFDPCAGSATFLVEAGLMASKCPPGIFRSEFGFMKHPAYDGEVFMQMKQNAREQMVVPPQGHLFGCEQDGSTYRKALKAIAKSGLMGAIDLVSVDFRKATLPVSPTCVVTNPPFGVRLNSPQYHMKLYEQLGDFLKQKTAKPATAAVLTASSEHARAIHLKPKQRIPIFHGGLSCFLLLFDLY